MPNIGVPELIIILVILLFFIGPGKLPSVFGGVGKAVREFRKAATDEEPTKPADDPKA